MCWSDGWKTVSIALMLMSAAVRAEEAPARGAPMVYRGDRLEAIRMPVGGIGAGCILMDGTGARAGWQLFNHFHPRPLPHSFFAARVKTADGTVTLRAMQGTAVGPFPAMKAVSFRGTYPFGGYTFEDADVPVALSLDVFNPLVPLDTKNSSIPCAIFNLTASNTTDQPVEVSFLAAQQNAVGYLGDKAIEGRAYAGYGGNRNALRREGDALFLHATSDRAKDAEGFGDMVLAAPADGASGLASWDSLENLADRFAEKGLVKGDETAGPSPAGQTLDGALAVSFTLAPGERRTVPFVLTWHFPNAKHGVDGWGGKGNRYANGWPDALAVAREVLRNQAELTRQTRLYTDTLEGSNLPDEVIQRVSSQVAILRSKTCFWTQDGYFGGWEGCLPNDGSGHGNSSHVWQYAQAHGRLFPELARRMREQEFTHQAPDGRIPYRQPADEEGCLDGQCGAVLNSYREHLMSPDGRWLAANWPKIKSAMNFIIQRWDPNERGMLIMAQWTTLDAALGNWHANDTGVGTSSWLGSLYLASLGAAERMARLQNDAEAADRYRRLFAAGSRWQDETLFNGEYYIQLPDPIGGTDYNTGCHIDQLLGQWWAHQLDLGWLYPRDRVRTALQSLLKYNARAHFRGLRQAPRKLVADDDAGIQMTTWPKGGEPPHRQWTHPLYDREVWSGQEYAAAALMIQAGLLTEGLGVVSNVASRYDGRLRTGLTPSDYASWGYSGNPFGDDESGKFHARAMSSWSLLLACQGFIYDGPAGVIGFKPVWQPEDHASLFTAAEGFGLFSQKRETGRQTERLEVRHGKLRVTAMRFGLPDGVRAKRAIVRADGREIPSSFTVQNDEAHVVLNQPHVVEAGKTLEVVIED